MIISKDTSCPAGVEFTRPEALWQQAVAPETSLAIAPRRLRGDFTGLAQTLDAQPCAPDQHLITADDLTRLRQGSPLTIDRHEAVAQILSDMKSCLTHGFDKISLRLLKGLGYTLPVVYLPHQDTDAATVMCTYAGAVTCAYAAGDTTPLDGKTQAEGDIWFSGVEKMLPRHNLSSLQINLSLLHVPLEGAQAFSWSPGDLTLHFGKKAEPQGRHALIHYAPPMTPESPPRLLLVARK